MCTVYIELSNEAYKQNLPKSPDSCMSPLVAVIISGSRDIGTATSVITTWKQKHCTMYIGLPTLWV